MKKIKQHKFTKVYDLQNSSRTSFYKRILFPNLGSYKWSSSETTLPANETKKEFDKKPVLERFDHQLKISGLKTFHTLKPDFSWVVLISINLFLNIIYLITYCYFLSALNT